MTSIRGRAPASVAAAVVLAAVLLVGLAVALSGQPGRPGGQPPTPTGAARPTELRVCEIAPNGPAQQAGIRPEDRIVGIDGQPLDSFDGLAGALQGHRPGDTVTLALARGPSALNATVVLGERESRAYLGLTGCAS